jgi:hypothetical protein
MIPGILLNRFKWILDEARCGSVRSAALARTSILASVLEESICTLDLHRERHQKETLVQTFQLAQMHSHEVKRQNREINGQ